MARDSAATKARILEAAFREFAAHGLAGARVDRIAATAEANKRAIYDYFGDKEQLFDTTLTEVLARGTEHIPRMWDDLPEMAGCIYDYWSADPDRIRIRMWRQLERPNAMDGEIEAYRKSIEEMTAARPSDSRLGPVELYALIWAMHFTWSLAPPALTLVQADKTTAKKTHEARRAAIVEGVRRLTTD
jgi:AcrR family transcriptional regulator